MAHPVLEKVYDFFRPSGLTISNPGGWGALYEGLPHQNFGEPVTPEIAMACAVANRCVMLISGIVASLDLCVFRDDPELGQIRATDHPLYPMLMSRPWKDRVMTAYHWKEQLQMNNLLEGNAYSVIRVTKGGKIIGFEHAPARYVRVMLNNDQTITYEVEWQDGRPKELVGSQWMLHIPGPGFNGIVGKSRISYAASSVALSRTLQQTVGVAHDNAMQPRTVVKVGADLSPDGVERLRAAIRAKSGRHAAGDSIILDAGSEIEQYSINLVDLNLIAASQATSLEVANYFGVPSVLLNIPSGATEWGSGIDSLWRAFYATTLGAELKRIEAEFNSKLFPVGNTDHYIAFDRSQLLQNDPKAQADIFSSEVQTCLSTPNEIRKRLHRPLVIGGDEPLINVAVQPLRNLLNPPQQPPNPSDVPPPSPQEPA